MNRMLWEDIYSVKIEELDNQHKKLVKMIDDLYKRVNEECNDRNETLIQNILLRLREYIVVHFETEERYFELYKYPDIENHIREHRNFSEQIAKYYSDYEKGRDSLKLEILTFLIEWLSKHILERDKEYSDFLRAKINCAV